MNSEEKESKYVRYLPSIYQSDKDIPASAFLGNFLKAFEKILSGIEDGVNVDDKPVKGIEEILDNIEDYFDPNETPKDFLKWLAGWVALTLKEGKTWEDKNRPLISRIVPLYQKRGTREGLEEFLKIYVGEGVSIVDDISPLRIGSTSRVGVDTYIEGLTPYFFIVDVIFTAPDPRLREEKMRAIKEIIDLEKPAHTSYKINSHITGTLKVGYSRVEQDTLLGDRNVN